MTGTIAQELRTGTPQDGHIFADVLVDSLNKWGDRTLFDQPAGERSYTYRETADRLARICSVLHELGVGRGRALGVLSTNCVEAWMAAMAPQILGGIYVALPFRSALDDLAHMVDLAELDILVVHPDLMDVGATLAERCPSVKHLLSLGFSDAAPDLLAQADANSARRLVTADGIRRDDVAQYWFTGGTTGRPKAAVHTQGSWMETYWRYLLSYNYPFPDVRYGAIAPLSHSGIAWVQPVIMTGGSVTVFREFDPLQFAQISADKQLNMTLGVPTMLYILLDVAEREPIDLSSYRNFIYGTAPIASDKLSALHEHFGQIFTGAYGTSESLGTGTVMYPHEHDPRLPDRLLSCGRPVPGTKVVLLDEQGLPIEPGGVGEICVRSASMMREYLKDPELTAQAFAGGWFHTGDLGRVDDEGFFTIVDRKKDMIITGGFNVFPAEVENVLLEDPSIKMAAVYGVPDDKWGEAVRATVVPATGATVDPDALIARVRERKGRVQAPKFIEVVESLPTTPAGKINRRALREPHWEGRERRI